MWIREHFLGGPQRCGFLCGVVLYFPPLVSPLAFLLRIFLGHWLLFGWYVPALHSGRKALSVVSAPMCVRMYTCMCVFLLEQCERGNVKWIDILYRPFCHFSGYSFAMCFCSLVFSLLYWCVFFDGHSGVLISPGMI